MRKNPGTKVGFSLQNFFLEATTVSLDRTEEERVKSFVGIIQGVVAVVLGAITLWVGTEVAGLGKNMVQLNARVDAVASKQEDLDRIWQLQLQQSQTTYAMRINAMEDSLRGFKDFARQLGEVQGDQARTRESIQKLWNQGRTNAANVKALARRIDPSLQLTEPNLFPRESP